MPPQQAAACCRAIAPDRSLTDDQISTILAWVDGGGAEGDGANPGPPMEPILGLSRVDLTLSMPESYAPQPKDGTRDDTRCFPLSWPETEDRYITGISPRPGNRAIVHHLILAKVAPDGADAIDARDEEDAGPGFDCGGGLGDLPAFTVLGGSLLGGDFPREIGAKVEAGSRIVLQIHYSLPETGPSDLSSIDLRLDDVAQDAKAIGVGNLAWLVDTAMLIPADSTDETYFYRFRPTLYTSDKAVMLQGVTPHAHRHASRIRVLRLPEGGGTDCLLEIPEWDFGWEQPAWFAEPLRLDPNDEVYIECHYRNPTDRDVAWGEDDQDMCLAFISFTDIPEGASPFPVLPAL